MPVKSSPVVVFFEEPNRYYAPDVIEECEFVTEKELNFNDKTYYNVIYPVNKKGHELQHLFCEMKPKTITKKNKVFRYCGECYNCIVKIDNDFPNRPLHKSCYFKEWYEKNFRNLIKLDGSIYVDMRK